MPDGTFWKSCLVASRYALPCLTKLLPKPDGSKATPCWLGLEQLPLAFVTKECREGECTKKEHEASH